MNKLFLTSLALLFCVNANAGALDYDSIWSCDKTKRNWYCDEQPEQTEQPQAKQVTPESPKIEKPQNSRIELKDIQTAEQMRAELARRLDIATMNPTPANVKDYIEASTVIQNKSSKFTDQWRRVVWQNPELDYSIQQPNNNTGIKVQQQQIQQTQNHSIYELSKKHGLIFFFRSDCTYCHAMAPTIRAMAQQFGIDVLPVSIDGKGLNPEFPQFKDGRAFAANWGVDKVPALFIASKDTAEHAPIGFGVMSLNEIIERMYVLTNTQPGDSF